MACPEGRSPLPDSTIRLSTRGLLSWGYLSSTPRWWYLGHAKDIYLMTRAQVRPKEDNVRPKVVDVGSSAVIILYVRSAPLA